MEPTMTQAMRTWGAIDLECPICHQLTLVYPNTLKGGNKSDSCLRCKSALQYEGGKAVIATYHTATPEAIKAAEEAELNNIAFISKTVFGIPERKLSKTLQSRTPGVKAKGSKYNLLQAIKRLIRIN